MFFTKYIINICKKVQIIYIYNCAMKTILFIKIYYYISILFILFMKIFVKICIIKYLYKNTYSVHY